MDMIISKTSKNQFKFEAQIFFALIFSFYFISCSNGNNKSFDSLFKQNRNDLHFELNKKDNTVDLIGNISFLNQSGYDFISETYSSKPYIQISFYNEEPVLNGIFFGSLDENKWINNTSREFYVHIDPVIDVVYFERKTP